MEQQGTKEAAESVLRELPSVVGAFVREDAHGYPREVHLLIAPGPKARHFALDVKALLEERLRIPIDQRIISIAQLAGPQEAGGALAAAAIAPVGRIEPKPPPVHIGETAAAAPMRARFLDSYTEVHEGRVTVKVRLQWDGTDHEGEALDIESPSGRVRASAQAALRAANLVCGDHGHFELDAASVVRVMDREYAVVSSLVTSHFIGRGPVALAGAQPVEDYVETAGALAALKSANRLLGWIARLGETDPSVPQRRGRSGPR
jgi:hypothetical protein